MKYIIDKIARSYLVVMVLLFCNVIHGQAPPPYQTNVNINYVRTWDATAPEVDGNTLMTRPLQDVRMSTQYFDGLGRPLQTVIKKGSLATDPNNPASSANAVDLVSSNIYDEYGREQFKYLPFAANNTNGNTHISDGLFKMNPFQQQATFYNNSFNNSPIAGQGETYFYSKTNFESSPLNRPQESFAPGVSWVGSAGQANEVDRRSVKAKYWINTLTDNVKIWQVSNSTNKADFGTYTIDINNNNGKYAAGELFKNVSIDEEGKQVIEFKDKEGKVILKKVQIGTTTGIADDGTGRGYDGWLSSYYIYDDLNNLRCVIQPEGVNTLNLNVNNAPVLTTELLAEQCFRYEYDNRNRMIMKKVPGAGEVYMVYDGKDRLVMTQDANMRNAIPDTQKWLITKYDALNRPQETGMWQNGSTTFENHLTAANIATIDYPTTTTDYETLTLTHYDDYTGLPAGLSAYLTIWNNTNYFSATSNTVYPYSQMPTVSNAIKGMVTWTQVKVLGTSTFLNSVIYYDAKGRPIQVQSTNLTGGTDIATTQYSWAGQPLVIINKTQKGQGSPLEENLVITKMQYDDLGRVISVKKKVKALIASVEKLTPEVEIVKNEYDALGQLKTKYVGKKKDDNGNYTANEIENLVYDYNIRGWLLGMNRNYLSTIDQATEPTKFGFELGYDKSTNNAGRNFLSTGMYNGNINGMVWKSDGDDVRRIYDFSYDAANRLMKADFIQDNSSVTWNNSSMNYNMQMGNGSDPTSAYDANGNIKGMLQKGWKLGAPVDNTIDNLSYAYFAGTNRLQAVTDAVTADNKMGDFTDKNTTATDYGYDKNGNLVTDLNKRINGTTGSDLNSGGAIAYNYLNLPASIVVKKDDGTAKGTITYTYDAAGNKLKKEVAEQGQPTKTTLYLGGQVYENDILQFIGHEEGRLRPIFNAQNQLQSFVFDYMLKDHLGNVRMVLTDEVKQDKYPLASLEPTKIATEKNYYDIQDAQVVPKSEATGITDYINDNGIGNNASDQTFEASNSTKLYKLNSSTAKTGLGITLKVMAGDKIDVFGKSYYFQNTAGTSGNSNLPIIDLLSAFLNAPGAAATTNVHGIVTAGAINTPTNITGINSMVTQQGNQSNASPNKPRAFINVIFFNEQFKTYDGGFSISMVGSNSVVKDHFTDLQNLIANKSGYVYIYCSNESPVNVFFDNIQVVHTKGPILEETHYYPFGLTMAGISSKAAGSIENKNKFVGKELQSKEFSDGSGLELEDFGARFYDVQIGRWHTLDAKAEKYFSSTPYNYVDNNPITRVDVDGHDWVVTVSDTKASDGSIMRTVNISVKVEVLNSSSNTSFNSAGFASAIKTDLINTYSSMSGQSTTERVGETYSSSPTTMIPVSNGDGKDVKVTYNVNVTADVSVITDISKKSKDSHLVEVVDNGTKGKLGDDGTAYGKAPFNGNQVYINEGKAQGMINNTDNNTVPHEFGHTAGLKHPDQQQWVFGLIKGSEYLDYNKNKNNAMFSNTGSYILNDATSTQFTLKQLQILITNYINGQLNKNTVGQ